MAVGDAGESPALGHLDQTPAQLRDIASPQGKRLSRDLDAQLVHCALRSYTDLVVALGDDRDVIHLREQLLSEVIDLGRRGLTAREDAEVDP